MNISHTDTKVLLVGRGLRHIDRMIETLNLVGAELFFADDAAEGLHLMSLDPPDFVISSLGLCCSPLCVLYLFAISFSGSGGSTPSPT